MNRYENTKKVGFLGIIGNLFLFIIKIIVALMSHSRALLADSLNSFGDIFSSLMTYIGNKIASNPSDDGHNLGSKPNVSRIVLLTLFLLIKK